MSTIAIPNTTVSRKKILATPWIIALLAVLVLLGGYLFARRVTAPAVVAGGDYHTVSPMDLIVRVQKDGELQAVNNIEIRCKVEGKSMVQTLVPEGSEVKKGDTLLVLDSSTIRQKIDDALLEVQKAQTEATAAREGLEIQQSTNAANLESAKVELLLAQLDLEQYEDGTYPQSLQDAQRVLDMAKITVANKEKDLEQTMSLYGKGFVTPADVEKSKLEVLTAQNELAKTQTQLMVLDKYTHRKDTAEKRNNLAQSDAKLARVQKENASNLSQKTADKSAKEQTLMLRQRKLTSLQEQLAACTVIAPTDGMVVYGSSGDRRSERRVAEGAEVSEKQVLIKLPETDTMMAIVRIPEAQKHKLREGQRARVKISGLTEPVWGTLKTIAVVYDSNQWWNPDLKEYPVEITLDTTPPNLKPGTSVQAEIFVNKEEDVLAVPLPAIFSTGGDRYVFVKNGNDVTPRKIEMGTSNETHAKVDKGLAAGDQVLMLQVGQGRELLERAGIAIAPPPRATKIPKGPKSPEAAQPASK